MKPNVLWIFGDQHRGQALSCAGDENVRTPSLDALAAGGVWFRNALAGSPLCCPARGSILTGRYPHECVPGHQSPLPSGQETIAHVFRRHGYRTAYFGKWHLDGFDERTGRAAFHEVPEERRGGFEFWEAYENNNSQYDCWVHGTSGKPARLEGYETDRLTDRLLAFLRSQADGRAAGDDRSFFAVLSVQPPHNPYVAPREWMERQSFAKLRLRPNVPPGGAFEAATRQELAGYYAMIENLDWNVGRIVETLRESGLFENTHILFFSDHGDMHGSHGLRRKTVPHEESIRVPLIISGLDPTYAGRRGVADNLVNHVDLAPTTLGLCGIPVPEGMRGFDHSPWRNGSGPLPTPPESAYLQMVQTTGRGHMVSRPWRGVVTADGWKYAAMEGAPWLLFDLRSDPYEMANLAQVGLCRDKLRELHLQLQKWIADTGDEFNLPDL